MSIPVLGEGQVRGLEDIDDVESLRKLGGGPMSAHFVTIPYSLCIDIRNYFVQIKYSLIYKF